MMTTALLQEQDGSNRRERRFLAQQILSEGAEDCKTMTSLTKQADENQQRYLARASRFR